MAWPSGAVVTTNVDATTDDPELGVVQIKDSFDKLNQIIAHVSAYIQGLLDDADAAAARATLGSTTVGDAVFIAASAAAARTALGLAALAVKATIATADIDADAVTYAKIQNVSATDKLLGRSTAGAGDVEEIACTAAARSILDDTTVAAILATLGGAPLNNPVFTGDLSFGSAPVRLLEPTAGTIASANDLSVTSNAARITGSVQINRLDSTGWVGGSRLTLIFAAGAAPLLKHNQAAGGAFRPMRLAGSVDFAATAHSTISFIREATDDSWIELCRKVS